MFLEVGQCVSHSFFWTALLLYLKAGSKEHRAGTDGKGETLRYLVHQQVAGGFPTIMPRARYNLAAGHFWLWAAVWIPLS